MKLPEEIKFVFHGLLNKIITTKNICLAQKLYHHASSDENNDKVTIFYARFPLNLYPGRGVTGDEKGDLNHLHVDGMNQISVPLCERELIGKTLLQMIYFP